MSFGRFPILFFILFAILQTSSWARCEWSTRGYSSPEQSGMCGNSNWCADNVPSPSGNPCYYSMLYSGETRFQRAVSCQPYYQKWSCEYDVKCCSDQRSLDSSNCERNNENWDSESGECMPDTTFKCISVSTENNVIRSMIQYIVRGHSVKEQFVLGSCIENGFCEGGGERKPFHPDENPTYAYDSCSYDSVSVRRCKFVGQNGSACNFVCPDGRNWMCRMATVSGVNIPQCPTYPWKDCADHYVPPKVNTPDNPTINDSLPISGWAQPDYSSAIEGLNEISNDLKHSLHNDKLNRYMQQQNFNVIGGYGAWEGDGIWQNTKRIDENLNSVNSNIGVTNDKLENVVVNQSTIIHKIDHDTIKVEVQSDSTKPVWVLPNWEPLVFIVDTNVQKVNDQLNEINNLVDTLVSDTPRTNKILQTISPVFDNIRNVLDTIKSNIPSPTGIVLDIADSIQAKLKPIVDVLYIDTLKVDSMVNWYDTWQPDTSIAPWVPDTLPNDSLPPIDSATYLAPFDDVYNYLDSLKREQERRDTTNDTLPLDQMAGDSVQIRNKLSSVFLTDVVVNSCFEFHMHPVVNFKIFKKNYSYDLSIVIDFADMFGWDLCELIRKIVEILTFIAIVFTTIKGYIRAFGGSNIGG